MQLHCLQLGFLNQASWSATCSPEGLWTRYRSKQASPDSLPSGSVRNGWSTNQETHSAFSSWLGEIGPCHLRFSAKSLHHSSPLLSLSSSAGLLWSAPFIFEARDFIRDSCWAELGKAGSSARSRSSVSWEAGGWIDSDGKQLCEAVCSWLQAPTSPHTAEEPWFHSCQRRTGKKVVCLWVPVSRWAAWLCSSSSLQKCLFVTCICLRLDSSSTQMISACCPGNHQGSS